MIFFARRNSVFYASVVMRSVLTLAVMLTFAFTSKPEFAWAAVIDEGGMTPGQANAGVIDRPMSQTVKLNKVQAAFDKAKPQDNTRIYPWKPNVTYKIKLREFMQSVVILPTNEKITGYVLGDTINFAVKVLPANLQRFIVFGRDPGADTNLTVFGDSGRIYSFYLRIDSVESAFVPDLLVYVMDDSMTYDQAQGGLTELALSTPAKEPGKEAAQKPEAEKPCLECQIEEYPAQQFQRDYLRELPQTSGKNANKEYIMSKGSRDLAPLAIFDDGFFTYFKFGDGSLDAIKVPVIYQVIDGYDSLLNTRVEGGYIVAETTNDKFTIRRGDKFLCIRNKRYAKTTALKD